MRDKDGFLIRCKNCEWKIVNNREDQDYVCQKFGSSMISYHVCAGDEHCRYYEPDLKEGRDNE